MRKYEIVCILNDKSDITALKDKIKNIITNNNGSIIEENDWGVKEFAYEIKKEKSGFYFVLIANTSSENINELLRINRITKEIIRVLVINTEKEKNYVQTTKLSATEIINNKIEHKTIGKKYKKRTFDIKLENNDNQKKASKEQNNYVQNDSNNNSESTNENAVNQKIEAKTDSIDKEKEKISEKE